jgi:ketosteroid isomerase-like protein
MTPVTPMTSRKHKQIGKVTFSDREIIYEYFRLVKNKDINRLLDLFADDGIVYEPFSNHTRRTKR